MQIYSKPMPSFPRSRRDFIRMLLCLGGGLLLPSGRAAEKSASDRALERLTRGKTAEFHRGVELVVPTTPETRLAVPVIVHSRLAGTDLIALLVSGNPESLAARFDLAPPMHPYIRTQLKIVEDSEVIAVVRAAGRYFQQRSKVSVSEGCD